MRIQVAEGDELGWDMLSRHCIVCGRHFYTSITTTRFCGRACQMRSWRAAKQLEGTHGMQGGVFRRLKVAE
jgi:anaerobic ribonucleoside-triphosphate reductase